MFPDQFEYRRAETVAETIEVLSEADDAAIIAGGHGLLPAMKAGEERHDLLVDVGDIDALRHLEVDGDDVAIGALTTHATLASSSLLDERAAVVAETARNVADVQIRNRGTIGGNLAGADPAADLPAAVLAADATIAVAGPDGERSVPATDFFLGAGETALAEDELLTAIRVPTATEGSDRFDRFGAYAKKTHPATGYAMVGVAAVVDVADGAIDRVRVAATGVTERPQRLDAVEDALAGTALEACAGETGDASPVAAAAERAPDAVADAAPYGDARASGQFRRELLGPYVERALTTALERATGGGPA